MKKEDIQNEIDLLSLEKDSDSEYTVYYYPHGWYNFVETKDLIADEIDLALSDPDVEEIEEISISYRS
jgi:hypothetical protein